MPTIIETSQNMKEKIKSRLLANILVDDNKCWVWQRRDKSQPYGKLTIGKNNFYYVHRLAAFVYLGYDINQNNSIVCHKCHNSKCINPEHLYIGTQSNNVYDEVANGTHLQARKITCPKGHPYTQTPVARRCKTCDRITKFKSYYKRKKEKELLNGSN